MRKSRPINPAVTIFTTVVSVAGVITTAVLAAKETPKAKTLLEELKKENPEPTKFEIVKTVTPAYAPAIISGVLTIASIVGTTILSQRAQASLASSYALLDHNYRRYKEAVKEVFGEDADQKVMDHIIISECENCPPFICGLGGVETLDFGIQEEEHLFYDTYSERYFTSTIGHVLQAEYHLNRNYVMGGGASINEFYEFLGLDPVVNGDSIGWDFDGGLCWIDFNHRTVELENRGGLPCLVIDYVFDPWKANEDYMAKR